MATNWNRLECEAIVDDYLNMLAAECRREPYSKALHRRNLQARLTDRSNGSIEYKHQNISAVLIRAGHIYIPGYKPAWNYQELLEEVVTARIASIGTRLLDIEVALIQQEVLEIQIPETASIIEPPPERFPERQIRENAKRKPGKINYAEREAANRALGERGEAFIVDLERARLAEEGRDDLAKEVEWTSKVQGDGTGYDIRSFMSGTDDPLYIEVKTTNSGKYQPFMVSENEVAFSSEYADLYSLYRVFDFARSPAVFILNGAVNECVDLAPTMYRASF